MFAASDFAAVACGGKLRNFAVDAGKKMQAMHQFIDAYGSFPTEGDKAKLMGDDEVRMVMHVHQKKGTIQSANEVLARSDGPCL